MRINIYRYHMLTLIKFPDAIRSYRPFAGNLFSFFSFFVMFSLFYYLRSVSFRNDFESLVKAVMGFGDIVLWIRNIEYSRGIFVPYFTFKDA